MQVFERHKRKFKLTDYGEMYEVMGDGSIIKVDRDNLLPIQEFTDSSTTLLNTETPHGTDTTTVYTCDTCGKSFKARIALAGHRRSHKKEVAI
jgi:uncharacterized protein affecting Mg2+/Co2+ transport